MLLPQIANKVKVKKHMVLLFLTFITQPKAAHK
ncbi:hypothetical protein MTCD1_03287 [Colwellia marinimaniae]|uniref:Uncharacterized protein n=1 Tax=Colwellia marinimaniae TaxID=1513592 RepID=A0ABQ0MZ48_9GAMM|nr:hypothetical protein MTCD1_03287 [Colwellia marinimaniae]